MFKFVIQDNKKYLVMRVSKKIYNSKLYPILQMSAVSLVVTLITGSCSLNLSKTIMAFSVMMCSLYILKLTVITILFRYESSSVMGGLNFFFPSKMAWYRSLRLVLQNRFMLFYITEVDADFFCYYKPILCFWRKDCHASRNHNTFQ